MRVADAETAQFGARGRAADPGEAVDELPCGADNIVRLDHAHPPAAIPAPIPAPSPPPPARVIGRFSYLNCNSSSRRLEFGARRSQSDACLAQPSMRGSDENYGSEMRG